MRPAIRSWWGISRDTAPRVSRCLVIKPESQVMSRGPPKLQDPTLFGLQGRRGYVAPKDVPKDDNGFEDINAYFSDAKSTRPRKRQLDVKRFAMDPLGTDSESSELSELHTLRLGTPHRLARQSATARYQRVAPVQPTAQRLSQRPQTTTFGALPRSDAFIPEVPRMSTPVRSQSDKRVLGSMLPHSPMRNERLLRSKGHAQPQFKLGPGSPIRSPIRAPSSPPRISDAPSPILPAADGNEEEFISENVIEDAPDVATSHDEHEGYSPPRRRYETADSLPPVIFDVAPKDLPAPNYVEPEDEEPYESFVEDDDFSDAPSVLSMISEVSEYTTDDSQNYEPTLHDFPDSDDDPADEVYDPERDRNMVDETTMLVPDVPPRPPGRLRRTTRHRVPTLQFWTGEHPVYKLDAAHLPTLQEVVAVDVPEPRPKKPSRNRIDGRVTAAIPSEVSAEIFNQSRRIFEERTVAKSINGLDFEELPDNPRVQTADLIAAQAGLPFQSTIMLIDKKGAIDKRNSGNYYYAFVVLAGLLSVTVHDKQFHSRRGMVFEVPRGNDFSIRNVGTTRVRMLMVQMRPGNASNNTATSVRQAFNQSGLQPTDTSAKETTSGPNPPLSNARAAAPIFLASGSSATSDSSVLGEVLAGLD